MVVPSVFDDGLSFGMGVSGIRSGPEGSSLNFYVPCSEGGSPEKQKGSNYQGFAVSTTGMPLNFNMEFINERTLRRSKPLDELDRLVLRFIHILEKHVDYVIISGYVAILLGRSRGTEDVDIFIKPLAKEKLISFYHELKANAFWCLNAESDEEVYSYLQEGIAVRFANKGETIPNFEVKFARKLLDLAVFTDFITVETGEGAIRISSLERQIAFKRYYLKSDKDLEDARHVEKVFAGHLDTEKIKNYKEMIEREYGKT